MSEKQLTQSQQEFREYCARWLEENKPEPHPIPLPQAAYEVTDPSHLTYLQEWQAKCWEVLSTKFIIKRRQSDSFKYSRNN